MKKDTIITKKVSISNLLRIIIISIIGIVLTIFSGTSLKYFIETPRFERESCVGTIVSKSQDEITIKHGTQTELYLNIQFDKIGFKSIEVEPTTYFGNNVGERVSFALEKQKSGFQIAKFIWGFILSGIAIIVLIVIFIKWLLDFKL